MHVGKCLVVLQQGGIILIEIILGNGQVSRIIMIQIRRVCGIQSRHGSVDQLLGGISEPVVSLHRSHPTLTPEFLVLKRGHTFKADTVPDINDCLHVYAGRQGLLVIPAAVARCGNRLAVAHIAKIGVPLSVRVLCWEERHVIAIQCIIQSH